MPVKIRRALLVIVLLAAGGSWQLPGNAQGVTEAQRLLQKAILLETVDGNLPAAIDQYKKIVVENGSNRVVAAKALLRLAGCYEKLGAAEAQKTYQQLINDYSDQTAEVALARQKLAALAAASLGQPSGPGFRKIAIPGEIASGARLSPDGARLAMASGGDIWLVNLRGQVSPEIAGAPERLTHGANAAATGLTWSGNGQWIAYNEYTIPTQNMYVLPVSGGSPRKLTRPVPLLGGGNPWWIGLSSDGSRLAYTTIEAQEEKVLRIVSTTTGALVMRLGNPAASEPRFSPDDSRLAYLRQWRGPTFPDGEVRVVRLADGNDSPVTTTPALFRSPAWSPDGSLLAFLAHPNRNDYSMQEVWITPVTGTGEAAGETTKIKLTRYAESIAGWGADNKIALLSRSPSRNAIYTVPLSGGKATQVTPNGDTFQPQWSPDGKSIYFRFGQNDIAFVPAAGGPIRVVPRSGETVGVSLPVGGNHISPDGTRIVWAGTRKTIPGVHLWTLPIAGGEPVRLPMEPDLNAFQPRWSPDGRWIAFESERPVPGDRKLDENIFVVPSQGGEPRQLTHHTDAFCELLAWSPGGDSIAYACSDKVIRIIPVGGGEPRTVLKVDELEHHQGSLAWTRDGAQLVYSAKGRLWTVSTSGGEPAVVNTDLEGASILQFALSPDGKTIAFNAPSGNDLELWLMEGFLPPAKGK
jgi:Tol biopolymer transport system component